MHTVLTSWEWNGLKGIISYQWNVPIKWNWIIFWGAWQVAVHSRLWPQWLKSPKLTMLLIWSVTLPGCRDVPLGAGGSNMELHAPRSHHRKVPQPQRGLSYSCREQIEHPHHCKDPDTTPSGWVGKCTAAATSGCYLSSCRWNSIQILSREMWFFFLKALVTHGFQNYPRLSKYLTPFLVFGRRECPRDPLCVHAAPHLPEVGSFHQAAAFQGLPVRQPEDFCHAELRRADQLSEIRAADHRLGFGSAPRAAGTSEGPLPRRVDPARGGGQLEVG